ncbi:hypothetical protein U1Q18_052801 [Sarracenia purpurea var. burkii]
MKGEVGSGEIKEQKSQSDSSSTSEWIKVKKRRNTSKEKRLDKADVQPAAQPSGYCGSQPARSPHRVGVPYRGPVMDQSRRPPEGGPVDRACFSVPALSPASRTSIVEGTGKLGNRPRC